MTIVFTVDLTNQDKLRAPMAYSQTNSEMAATRSTLIPNMFRGDTVYLDTNTFTLTGRDAQYMKDLVISGQMPHVTITTQS